MDKCSEELIDGIKYNLYYISHMPIESGKTYMVNVAVDTSTIMCDVKRFQELLQENIVKVFEEAGAKVIIFVNTDSTSWDIREVSKELAENIKTELKEKGYNIE